MATVGRRPAQLSASPADAVRPRESGEEDIMVIVVPLGRAQKQVLRARGVGPATWDAEEART